MKVGGARPGAGRKKGGKNRKTRELAEMISASGLTPLEFMLGIMRNEDAPQDVRADMAKSAAPYMHPRLGAVAINAEVKASINLIDDFPG